MRSGMGSVAPEGDHIQAPVGIPDVLPFGSQCDVIFCRSLMSLLEIFGAYSVLPGVFVRIPPALIN